MPATAILNLYQPEVRIEFLLARDLGFDIRFRHEYLREETREKVFCRTRVIKSALRRRAEKCRRAVEFRDFDENCARFLRAAAADYGEAAFVVAAADISRNPDRTFETHECSLVDRRAVYSSKLGEKIVGHQAGDRHHPVALEAFDRVLGVRTKGAGYAHRAIT